MFYLYEPADPLSAMWAKLQPKHGDVSRREVKARLAALGMINQVEA